MRLKVFQASHMGAAMAAIRAELGDDALILGTQTIEGGIEVTAACEPAREVPPTPEPAREAALEWHRLPAPLAGRLAAGDTAAALADHFTFAPLDLAPGAKPLVVVGPPGAGKTMTIARLATRLVLAGHSAHVVTADGRRAGAAEQLAAFTRLLGMSLLAADSPLMLGRAVAHRAEGACVLVDMPGLFPGNAEDRQLLEASLAAIGACTVALVLPTGLDPVDARELADGFKSLGASRLIATRLDQSRRLGGILAAAQSGLALAEMGVSAGVADALQPITPERLAERLAVGAPLTAPTPAPRRDANAARPSALARMAAAGRETSRLQP